MKLPQLRDIPYNRRQIIEFKGYNHNPHIVDGEFYNMHNLTSSIYPVLSPRKSRGAVQDITKPNGLFAKNKLAWVDGTNFIYDGIVKGTVSDGQKQFASMGAYILIFPDKVAYNTFTDEFTPLENSFTSYNAVFYVGSGLDGSPVDGGENTYIKIASTGIDVGFKQYDGITISGSDIPGLNKTTVIQAIGDGYIVVPGLFDSNTSQNTPITIKRTVPDMEFFTESENRLWGCSSEKHEIYASKLGDPFNWNCYEGISTDSYAVTIGSDGDFTGAFTFNGLVLFFKEDIIHKVYGNKPSNFQVMGNACRGVAKGSEKSLAIVNETLYYLSRNGVVGYHGTMPESVSHAFGDETYTDGVAGSLGNKYYISMKDRVGNYNLFVLDESLGLWHREDNLKAKSFVALEGKLYFIEENKIKMMDTGSEIIEWFGETGEFTDRSMFKKYMMRLQFLLELEQDSVFEISISYDGGSWEKVKTISTPGKRSYLVPVKTRRCDYYKIKLSGTGNFKLHGMTKVYAEGSDI